MFAQHPRACLAPNHITTYLSSIKSIKSHIYDPLILT
jgi:hypothetical protein